MKKSVIVLFGMLASAASLSASAQTPAWFAMKHPEVKVMERMQAQESIGGKSDKHQIASHDSNSHRAANHPDENDAHSS